MLAVCFAGTHTPLLAFVGWQVGAGTVDWPELTLLLLATLVGTAFTLVAIDGLLAPVRAATASVAALERDQLDALEAVRCGDILGELIAGVERATQATRMRVATLDRVAHRDPLTALWNRRGFLTQTRLLQGGAIALLDIDRFKSINDRFGHPAGDEVLKNFARFIARGARHNDYVARWGGEEFVILFPDASDQDATVILQRMMADLAGGAVETPDAIPVTFSAGVVDLDGETVEMAIARADAALYAAKHGGRNQIRVGETHERASACA